MVSGMGSASFYLFDFRSITTRNSIYLTVIRETFYLASIRISDKEILYNYKQKMLFLLLMKSLKH